MLQSSGDPPSFRRQFQRQILTPISIVIFAIVLVAAFGLYWAASTSNAVSLERQADITRRGLISSADQLSYEQQVIGRWDELSQRLSAVPFDTKWLDAHVGASAIGMFRHDIIFIVDHTGRPVYGYDSGQSLSRERFAVFAADLKPMVDAVRAQAAVGRRPDADNASPAARRSTELTQADTIYASYTTQVDGRPAAAGAMLITSGARGNASNAPILVSVRFLDGTFLRELSAWSLIDSPRYSRSPVARPGEATVPFLNERGKPVGYIFWKPELPGSRILGVLGPLVATLILVMISLMGLLVRSLWRSGHTLAGLVVDLRASEAQAQHLAFHDVLTGLPNRALFEGRLEQALARARRGESCTILALDLDRFKQVNDTLGHSAGDTLIREFAARLSRIVRAMDTVARIGGDEFTILLCDTSRVEDIDLVCERILAAVRQPFELLGSAVYVGVSIGVVLVPDVGTDRGDLMRKADIALYRAKSEGRDCYRTFTPSMDETIKLRSEIEEDLRRALANGNELEVHYQAEVDAATGTIVGLEALVRWLHPTRGLMLPEQFIPIAEETGLISVLGEGVLAEACRVARNCPGLFIAVNLSAIQFRSSDLAVRLIAIARNAGCDPRQIELELTESVLLDEDDTARTTLIALREAGFRIALDDFGTGYSSLSYLREFKVDKIKIDRSFTQNLGHDAEAAAIVTSVVTLGHAMGLTVTAEGVESRAQMQLLAAAGCNELQGFLFSRALPENAIAALLASNAKLRDVA
ncbi:EAL domain-containing protein [Novosphingobium hassiacum]